MIFLYIFYYQQNKKKYLTLSSLKKLFANGNLRLPKNNFKSFYACPMRIYLNSEQCLFTNSAHLSHIS